MIIGAGNISPVSSPFDGMMAQNTPEAAIPDRH